MWRQSGGRGAAPCCPHFPPRSPPPDTPPHPTWALSRARWPRRVAASRREGGGALLPGGGGSQAWPSRLPRGACSSRPREGREYTWGGGQEGDTSFDRLLILRSERIVCPPAVRPRAVRPHAYPACSAPPNPSPAYTPHTSLLPPLSLSLSLSLPLPPSLPPFFLSPSPSLTHLQHRLLPLLSGIDGNQARRPVSVEGARVQQGVRQRHLGLGPAIPCQDVGHTGRGGDTVWVWGSEGGSKLDGRGGRTIRACMQQHSRCSYSPVPTALTCTL